MRQLDRLRAVGESAGQALASQGDWIHRRVESITFPFPDRPIYRRYVSVDFTIPTGLVPGADSRLAGVANRGRYYVPLSLIRKWPPVSRLDLRDPDGRPIPFLTGGQNAVLDAAALVGLAKLLAGEQHKLPDGLQEQIARIASGKGDEPARALQDVLDASTEDPALLEVRSSDVFRGLAQALRLHTLLWLRVDGCPEDREVVKFSYDMPMEPGPDAWSKASFGLEHFVFEFETPHLGATGSYHCNVVAPPPLEVLRAEMAMYERPKDGSVPKRLEGLVRYSAKSTEPPPESARLSLFTAVAESQAKFYASGRREELDGMLYVAVVIRSQEVLRGAVATALAAAAVIGLFLALLASAVKTPEPVVAVLILTPIVLGSVIVRPLEHALAGGFLVGIRRAVVIGGIVPVLAAALVATADGATHGWLYVGMAIATAVEAATAALLATALIAGRAIRKDSTPDPASRLR